VRFSFEGVFGGGGVRAGDELWAWKWVKGYVFGFLDYLVCLHAFVSACGFCSNLSSVEGLCICHIVLLCLGSAGIV
jgi:hypothetical protein